ncbi:MAG TPA: FimV/HubP family polar landmark protein [Methylophilaceae bacterium]|nr:FimV/HubP family polar landmark protein [Methylophilaceae bacterium]
MHKSKLRWIPLAVSLAFLPLAADAAGLGKLTVLSGLGEPLTAEIDLLSTTPEELSSLTAVIAPEEAYALQGVERVALHNTIKIEVVKKPDGTPALKLTTRQPVNDPFLDMLIQVDWSTGRLVREYTVLLDPPGYSNQGGGSSSANTSRTTTVAPSGKAAASGSVKKSGGGSAKSTKKTTAPAPVSEQESNAPIESAPAPTGEEYTTARGDTLNSIASQMQVEGVSLEQMLVGLYRANKNAFAGNMNRLKVGQVIRVPSAEELQGVSRKEAAQEIRVQTADWNAYRNKLAGLVADSAASGEEANNQSAGGKITAPAEDKAAAASAGPRDVVKLSKSDAAPGKANDTKAMQDKLNSLQEEITAREKNVQEANDRTAALEKQVADMQKLLAIKNQAMADIQKNAGNPAAPAANAATSKPEVAPAPAAVPEPSAPAAAAPEASAASPATEPMPAPAAPANPETAPAPKKAAPTPPPVPEPGVLDSLNDPMLLGGAGGALALLGGIWLFLRNKRKRGLDSFEQGILTSGGLKANTVFGNTAGGTVDTGDTSFLTDFSQSGGGMIDTHDVDPIAEAEVYMAYGRDAQAEEILKDAIAKEPKRYELHLKLLEILASRNDSSGFETIAGELYATLGSGDPAWSKIAEMGRKLEPDNPLYTVGNLAIPVAAVAGASAASSHKLEASDFDNAEFVSESNLDFSVGADSISSTDFETLEQPKPVSDLDFDLGAEESKPATAEAGPADLPELNLGDNTIESNSLAFDAPPMDMESAASDLGGNTLDFQLDLPEQVNENTVQLDISDFGKTVPGLDFPDLEMPKAYAVAADAPDFKAAETFETNDLPEFEPVATPSDIDNTLADISFDLPEMSPPEPAISLDIPAEPAPPAGIESTLPEISFDLPEINTTEPAIAVDVPAETTLLDLSEFDKTSDFESPDFDKTVVIQPEATSEEIVFESAEQATDLDFNFDLDVSGTEIKAEEVPVSEHNSVPEIDLSGISLNFDTTPGTEAEKTLDATGESADVETKLDLVTAYMDMGDNEGARELLEEVLKEGGPHQRQRAQQIINSLG